MRRKRGRLAEPGQLFAGRFEIESLIAAGGMADVYRAVDRRLARDLCASNLFAMYDGTVRVADLGIASGRDRFARGDDGVFRGKMGYAAPEALRGEPAAPAADVWSLGIVLWELLARHRLFPSASERVRSAILDLSIPAASGFSGDVPYALDAVVMRALDRDPGARYPTARAMASAIHDALIELSPAISYGAIAGFVAGVVPDGLARHRALVRQAITGADGW